MSSPRSSAPPPRGIFSLLATVAFAVLLSACAPEPLPEAGSADATLYAERCGGCHRLYQPRVLTPKMWEAMVERMDIEFSRRGQVLTAEDRERILDYLRRNGGVR